MLALGRPDVEVVPFDERGVSHGAVDSESRQHRAVEALRRGEVGDGDPDVVEHGREILASAAASPRGRRLTPAVAASKRTPHRNAPG